MELFKPGVDRAYERIEALYARARSHGPVWVQFLDLCFDGGDGVEEAEGLLAAQLEEMADAERALQALATIDQIDSRSIASAAVQEKLAAPAAEPSSGLKYS